MFGALPGTSSNFDDWGDSLRLMHVPQKRVDDKNNSETNDITGNEENKLGLTDVLNFYAEEFKQFPGGLTFDLNATLQLNDKPREFPAGTKIGRGYARFAPI